MALGIRTVEWWSVRKRLADLEVLREIVTPGPGIRLLDLGGGAGAATERFARGCAEIVILEPNAKKVAYGRRRRPAVQCARRPLPLVRGPARGAPLVLQRRRTCTETRGARIPRRLE